MYTKTFDGASSRESRMLSIINRRIFNHRYSFFCTRIQTHANMRVISNVLIMSLYNYKRCGAVNALPPLPSTSSRGYCGRVQPFVTTKIAITPVGTRCSSYIITAVYNPANAISCNAVYMDMSSSASPYVSECAYLPFSNVSVMEYKCKRTSIFYTDCPPSPPPQIPQPLPPASPPTSPPTYSLDSRGRWLVLRRFASADEVSTLLSKAMRLYERGELQPNPYGPSRFFAKVDEALADPLLDELTERCERILRLGGVATDLVIGRIVSLIQPGGFINRHSDAYHPSQPGYRAGYEHLRANIVVRLRCLSGRPVIEGEPLDVEEGDMWVFFASRSLHETSTIQGTEPRVVYGWGWSVPPGHALVSPPE